MTFTLLYWHWLVFGMILIITEIFIPSFTIFWFGLGAIIVAVVLLLVPGLPVADTPLWQLEQLPVTALWSNVAGTHAMVR